MRWGPRRVAIGLTCALLTWTSALQAQSYRGWAGTSVQVLEVRPFGLDTVPRSEVVTDFQGRLLHEGHEVTCVLADICTGYLPLAENRTVVGTQDLSLTFWGFGVEGLSATTLLRGRARAGGDLVWPRSDDEFDAMLAYAQLQRGDLRLRAGRQEVRSGLGISGFDGVSGAFDRGVYRAEVYGGRSLARGLREPANRALAGLEDFFIDEGAYLIGAGVTARRWGGRATARYHREIHADRSGLVSERASLDATTVLPRARISSSLDYDHGFRRVGKGHLTLSMPLADGRWLAELAARRYVPYFDLSTLWGFFEPVSYSEVLARVGWSPRSDVALRFSGGRRSYGQTGAPVVLEPLRDVGWRAELSATWTPTEPWSLSGGYDLEWGPGGFLSAIDVAARYAVNDRLGGGVSLMSFQKLEEFRLGDGRAFGLGVSADYDFAQRLSASAGLSVIRHRDGGTVFTSPWNQSRAWSSLRVEIGGDPGLRDRGGRQ